MRTEEDIRAELTRRSRRRVSEKDWEFLKDLRQVSELLTGEGEDESMNYALTLLKAARRYATPREARSTSQGAELPEQERRTAEVGERSTAFSEALSVNVAVYAQDDLATDRFRTAHLPDGLIHLGEVAEWIRQQAQHQPAGRSWARVPVPEGWKRGMTLPSAGAEVTAELLDYVVPGKDSVQRQVVAAGSVLAALRRLATGLATAHGWEPGQAATWVLTGVTPRIGLIRVTEGRSTVRDSAFLPWSERITLDVHPAALPEEVAEAYRGARQRLEATRTEKPFRLRSQSVQHLHLATFVAHREKLPWAQTMAEWNATEGKDKPYRYVSNFRRDADLARDRVLARGYPIGRTASP